MKIVKVYLVRFGRNFIFDFKKMHLVKIIWKWKLCFEYVNSEEIKFIIGAKLYLKLVGKKISKEKFIIK